MRDCARLAVDLVQLMSLLDHVVLKYHISYSYFTGLPEADSGTHAGSLDHDGGIVLCSVLGDCVALFRLDLGFAFLDIGHLAR